MFITELFMVAKIWKQPKYPSMDEGVRKCEMDIDIDTAIDIEKLFSLKKERNPSICHNMDEAGKHYAKWNNLIQKDKYLMISLTCVI